MPSSLKRLLLQDWPGGRGGAGIALRLFFGQNLQDNWADKRIAIIVQQ
jgi:hypothetical protein